MFDRTAKGILAIALVGACFTPSVPIPPPEPEKMAFDVDLEAGTAQFTYEPNPLYSNGVVYIFNRDQGVGVITTARGDGSVPPTEPFAAVDGDQIVISIELDMPLASTCVELHQGRSSSEYECAP